MTRDLFSDFVATYHDINVIIELKRRLNPLRLRVIYWIKAIVGG